MGYISFIIVQVGFYLTLGKKFKEKNLLWLFIFSFQSLILYLGALGNQLEWVTIVIKVIGFLLATMQLIRIVFVNRYRKTDKPFKYIQSKNLILLLFVIFWIFILNSAHFTHYDNYSHWAIIVKFLFTEQHLPTIADSMIDFKSYAPGSALFINYFLSYVGFSTGNMIVGQFLLIVASLSSILSIVRGSNKFVKTLIVTLFFGLMSALNTSITYTNLLVDFLLPVMSVGLLAGINSLKNNVKHQTFYLIIVGGYLSIIKNSALLFIFISLIFYFYTRKDNIKSWKEEIVRGVIAILSVFTPYIIWNQYVKRKFGNQSTGKHTMSISNYQSVLENKPSNEIRDTIETFFNNIINFNDVSTNAIMLIMIMFLFTGIFFYIKTNQRNILKGFVYAGIVEIIYYLSLLAMYLFSMSSGEALRLAGFGRYTMTMAVYILGIYTLLLVYELNNVDFKFNSRKLKFLGFSLIFSILIVEIPQVYHTVETYSQVDPLEEISNQNMKLNNSNYMLITENTNWLDYHRGKYYFYSPNIQFTNAKDFSLNYSEADVIQDFDYVIVLYTSDFLGNDPKNKLLNISNKIGSYPIFNESDE